MSDIEKNISCDVAIIGTGPSGLAAAITLKKKGIDRVIVLEREAVAGGIPRHCGHPPFGIREFNRIFTGPAYAKKIIAAAIDAGVEIWLNATVVKLVRGGLISIVTPDGFCELKAKRVLIATGTRETPRSARFVSGSRPIGIYNTGALQSLVYLNKKIPFRNPVIVGTEIVSFSALFTCWKAGIKPVAMLEKNKKASVVWPVSIVSKVVEVPLLLSHNIRNITGEERVRSVVVEDKKGNQKEITCDGVLFTGNFTPESSLMRLSHLEINSATGEPVTDGLGRCSDHSYFVAGNVQFTPVKVAGKCWKSGCEIAEEMSKHL